MAYSGVNWNEEEDSFTQIFWNQFIKQFWVDKDVGIGKDIKDWARMVPDEKDTLKKSLVTLTVFDTWQAKTGISELANNIPGDQRKAVLSFMGTMEHIHAKSYSTIFTTLMEKFEIDELFEWSEENKLVQYKIGRIVEYYKFANHGDYDLYMALVSSVYLESFLFYSGFFFPLYLAGHGRMMATADMINLILRDESIHGVYIGMLAQELYKKLTPEEQIQANEELLSLLNDLIENEIKYTHEIYGSINLAGEVVEFVKYNANKALMNLGKEPIFQNVVINPIVEAGLNTETKTHDFFSVKGNGYIKANIKELEDEDFNFESTYYKKLLWM